MRPLLLISAVLLALFTSGAYAQLPPAGKYDTSSYPEDRRAIGMLGRTNDSTRFRRCWQAPTTIYVV